MLCSQGRGGGAARQTVPNTASRYTLCGKCRAFPVKKWEAMT